MSIPLEIAPRAHESILARERSWAARNGLALDPAGHLADAADALCFSPEGAHLERLERHPDFPLGEGFAAGSAGKPALVGRLGSAWSLACNLIEATPTDRLTGLLAALGAPGRAVRRGWVHPSPACGTGATPMPLVRIDRDGAKPLFVELLGAELALTERATTPVWPGAEEGWGDLEGCRQLATESTCGHGVMPMRGTLRRIRTLCRSLGTRGFRYVVVRPHFDARFDEALHRAFDGARMRIGGEIDFDALDVATLHGRLSCTGDDAHPALAWLADRHLAGVRRTRA